VITCEDWQTAAPEILAPLYDAECARWYQALGWDYRPSCGLVEAARVGGRLPGLLARDEGGEIVGWSYFLPSQDALQIGNLVARDADAGRALLRAVVGRPEARRARRLYCFLFPYAAAIEQALRRARFSLLRHAYLQRRLTSESGVRPSKRSQRGGNGACLRCHDYLLREWSPDVIPDLLTLFSGAYAGTPEARCFAPDGDIGQWATYVHQLVQTPACGRFERGLSFVMETGAGEMAGAILVTALSTRMAHIAQMAVAPGHRRRGVGDWMVQVACERARQARYEAVTLLVAESNQRARRLYDRNGFEPRADFLFADRIVPG
jgi:ribosomal protein S18 acetylase RimI-like enzyme